MLASKNKVTNSLLRSEQKSLYRFLALYIAMVIVVISLLSIFYYESKEKIMLYSQRLKLNKYSYIQAKRLKALHHQFNIKNRLKYPIDSRFHSAIYDIEYIEIFSNLIEKDIRFDKEIYRNNKHIYFLKSLNDFYLGTKYLIIEVDYDKKWRLNLIYNIVLFDVFIFIFFVIMGLYLAKLFLKPMRNSLLLLDRFIKDTTHELNTPLSAVLANIEMMDRESMSPSNIKKLNRINIGAKSLSILYQDLTYLTLEQERENEDETLDIKSLIIDRIDYFNILMKSKNVTSTLDLEYSTIYIDKRKFIRILDNLISNAIKYNRRNGDIEIFLRPDILIIKDYGIGIDTRKIPFIFDRYSRFNSSEGGFGIGLNIVKGILDEYNIDIKVKSKEGKWTEFTLNW